MRAATRREPCALPRPPRFLERWSLRIACCTATGWCWSSTSRPGSRCMRDRAAVRTSNTGSRCCASACRGRRRWRTGSTATPRAVWCSAGTRRRCGGSGGCSPRGWSRKCTGRSSSGVPRESEGRIEAALAKQPRGTVGWRMVVDPDGQRAVTDYRVLGAGRWAGLARTEAAHRAHAPDPRALRRARRVRWSATRPMAGRPIIRCSCTRARSRCRSIRRSRRSRSRRRCRRTCCRLLTGARLSRRRRGACARSAVA